VGDLADEDAPAPLEVRWLRRVENLIAGLRIDTDGREVGVVFEELGHLVPERVELLLGACDLESAIV
jgi:hypothetical protein